MQTLEGLHCCTCKQRKPASEFHKNRRSRTGHVEYCKLCENARRRARYAVDTDLREKMRIYLREWQKANPEKCRQYASDRRAQVAAVFDESIDYAVVYERDKGTCGICSIFVAPKDFHLDHVIAIANGGRHNYNNVQTSHSWCNLAKGKS